MRDRLRRVTKNSYTAERQNGWLSGLAIPSYLAAVTTLMMAYPARAEDVAAGGQSTPQKVTVAVPLTRAGADLVHRLDVDPLTRDRALQALQIPGATVEFLTEEDAQPGSVVPLQSVVSAGESASAVAGVATGASGASVAGGSASAVSGSGSSSATGPATTVASAAVNPPLDRSEYEVPLWQDPLMLRIDAPFHGAPEILTQLAGAIELGAPRAIKVEVMPARELQARARERIVASQGKAQLQAREQAYKRLGLLPETYELRQTMLEQYPARVLGLYSPASGTVELAEGLSPSLTRAVLAREVVHALQDQNFSLQEVLTSATDEKARTLRGVVEGQALLASRQVVGMMPGTTNGAGLTGTCPDPFALAHFDLPLFTPGSMAGAESPLASLGGAFLEQYSRRFGPTSGALAALPASTEQLIHFEKYVSGEKPQSLTTVELFSQVGKSWKAVEQTSLGEMLTACWLGESLGGLASSGWGNDVLTAFQGPNARSMIVWRTVWDSEQDAVEFAGAARAHLRAQFDTVTFLKQLPFGLILATDEEAHGVVRMGSEVRVVIGGDVDGLEKLLTAEW